MCARTATAALRTPSAAYDASADGSCGGATDIVDGAAAVDEVGATVGAAVATHSCIRASRRNHRGTIVIGGVAGKGLLRWKLSVMCAI